VESSKSVESTLPLVVRVRIRLRNPIGSPTGVHKLKPLYAYGMIILAATMWGSFGVMTKALYSLGLDPWSLTFYRTFFGFICFAVVVFTTSRSSLRVRKEDIPFLALYGLVSTAAFHAVYIYTISIMSVAVASVLLYTAPGFSAIMARFVFGEPLTRTKVAALLLAFAGCTLVAGAFSGNQAVSTLGIATGLGSAVTYSSFGIMGKRARERYDSWTVNFYCMGFASLFLVPLLAIPGAKAGPYPTAAWVLLGVMALGPTMLSRLLYLLAVKHVEASRAAIAATIEPVSAAVFALLLLGELLSPMQLLGGFLVLAGAVLAQRPSRSDLGRRTDAEASPVAAKTPQH
jgi:drug/metabolite transporter, DME family